MKKEIALVLTRNLFSNLVNQLPKETRVVFSKADCTLSSQDSFLIYWKNIEWENFLEDCYSSLMLLIASLLSLEESKEDQNYLFLECNQEFSHLDSFGSYYNNPWQLKFVDGSIKILDTGNEVNLLSFM